MIDAAAPDGAPQRRINEKIEKMLETSLPRRASTLSGFSMSKNPFGFFSRLIPAEFEASERP